MAISLNAASKTRQLFSALSSCDLTVNAGTGSNRLLVAIVIQRGTLRTISSVTYNSVALTLAASQQITGQQEKVSLYYLVNPTSSSNTLNVSFSGGTQNQTELMACVFEGVLQSNPLDQSPTAEGNDAAPTVNITPSTNNQLIVGGVLHEDIDALTVGAGETSLWDTDQGAWVTSASYAVQTTATTQAINWTASGSDVWAVAAASFKEAVTATSVSVTDTGAGADAIAGLNVSLVMTDSGAGADALPGTAASLTLTDSGSAVDSLAQLLGSLISSDSGNGVEALTISAGLSVTDSVAGQDGLSVTAQITVADQGSADELVNILTTALKQIFESGSGSDSVTVSVGVISLADAGAGSEALRAAVELVITDSGAGVELINILQTTLKEITDFGAGTDAINRIDVALQIQDNGSGVETIAQILASLVVTDLGAGVDVSVHFDLSNRIFKIVFSLARPVLAFSFSACGIEFSLARPSVGFALSQEA